MPESSPIDGKTRVLVVDDHPIVRQGLSQLLARRPELIVCGEADSIDSANEAVKTLKPDLILLDLRLGTGDSIEFIKELRMGHDDLRILVISQHSETIFAERCLRAGADGYLTKQEASQNVRAAIEAVLRGEHYLSEQTVSTLGAPDRSSPSDKENLVIASLTDRELYVFQLLGSGLSTREIAGESGLSIKTIGAYCENIKGKLGSDDRRDLVQRAVAWVEGRADGL